MLCGEKLLANTIVYKVKITDVDLVDELEFGNHVTYTVAGCSGISWSLVFTFHPLTHFFHSLSSVVHLELLWCLKLPYGVSRCSIVGSVHLFKHYVGRSTTSTSVFFVVKVLLNCL